MARKLKKTIIPASAIAAAVAPASALTMAFTDTNNSETVKKQDSGKVVSKTTESTKATNSSASTVASTAKHKVTIKSNDGGAIKIGSSVVFTPFVEEYEEGSEITIHAAPFAGYELDKWGDGSTLSTKVVKITGDVSLSVNFKKQEANGVRLVDGTKITLASGIDLNELCGEEQDSEKIFIPVQGGKKYSFDKEDIETLEINSYNHDITAIGNNFLTRFSNLKTLKINLADSNITSIGNNFLAHCSELNCEIALPKSLETIGDGFMQYCQQFNQRIALPDTLKSYGKQFFWGCRHLNKGYIINNKFNILKRNVVWVEDKHYDLVDNIDPNIFCKSYFSVRVQWWYSTKLPLLDGSTVKPLASQVTSLELLSCDPKVKKLGDYFLTNCGWLRKIDLSGLSNIESIGDCFLEGCRRVNSFIQLPEGLKAIGEDFMRQCESFNQPLAIPNGVTHIKEAFMAGCDNFNSDLILPAGLETIGDKFMGYCERFNQRIYIPQFVTSIGDKFMYDCHRFNKKIYLPRSLRSIGDQFLSYCYIYNQELVLPENLEKIGSQFFEACHNFNCRLVIPKSVKKIGDSFMFRRVNFDQKNFENNSSVTIDWGRSEEAQAVAELLLTLFTQAVAVEVASIAGYHMYREKMNEQKAAAAETELQNKKSTDTLPVDEKGALKTPTSRNLRIVKDEKDFSRLTTDVLTAKMFVKDETTNETVGISAQYLDLYYSYNEVCEEYGKEKLPIDPSYFVKKYGIIDANTNTRIPATQYYSGYYVSSTNEILPPVTPVDTVLAAGSTDSYSDMGKLLKEIGQTPRLVFDSYNDVVGVNPKYLDLVAKYNNSCNTLTTYQKMPNVTDLIGKYGVADPTTLVKLDSSQYINMLNKC